MGTIFIAKAGLGKRLCGRKLFEKSFSNSLFRGLFRVDWKFFLFSAVVLFTMFVCLGGAQTTSQESTNEMIQWRVLKISDRLGGTNASRVQRIGISVKMNLVKISETGTDKVWLYNLDTRRFWLMRFKKKVFAEDSFSKLKSYYKMLAQDERFTVENEKQRLKFLEEGERGKLEKEIEQRLVLIDPLGRRFKVLKSPLGKETIAGQIASPFEVRLSGDLVETVWIADNLKIPTGWRKFLDIMSEINPMDWKIESTLDGVALKGEMNYGGLQISWDCLTISTSDVALSDFNIPLNLKMVSFEEALDLKR